MHDNSHQKDQPLVQNAKDPRFLQLRSLQSPLGRARTGHYLIEGIRHVARAVESHAPIQSLFVAPDSLTNPFGQKLARRLRRAGIPTARLTPHLYRDLTLAAEPQGLGAVLRQQWLPLEDARPTAGEYWLAVESIDSPGNLGTMLRTAEATGVAGTIVIGGGVDPHEPAAIRASMGSLFSQRLVRCGSAKQFTDWARACQVTLIGSSPHGLLDYKALRCRGPAALLIGSEKRGLSDQLTEACDFLVRIPMLGQGDSINAAVAAGVLLYELFNQRRGARG